MAKIIFVSGEATSGSPLTQHVEKTFEAKLLPFSAKAVLTEAKSSLADLVIIYAHMLTALEEAELLKIFSFADGGFHVVLVGLRDVCTRFAAQRQAVSLVKKCIYTPISAEDFTKEIRRIIAVIDGTAVEEEKEEEVKLPHVLVVDDDPVYLRTMMNWLKDKYKVSVVKSGEAAFTFLLQEIPDLILLDYEMPGWDGPTTLKRIQREENLKKIPVVFLTGVSDMDSVKVAGQLKPRGYLLKKVTQKQLLDKIEEILIG